MASMNFPANPTVGQEYVWEDFIYEWDGEKWTTQVTVVADNHVLKTGDTMTGNFKVKADTLSGTQINTSNGISAIMHMKADGKYTGRYVTFDSGIVEFHDYDGNDNLRNKYLNWNPNTPSLAMMHPHSASVQGTAASSLTRKDYVDLGLLAKADASRVDTLEATISTLLARIEALEAQVNPAP